MISNLVLPSRQVSQQAQDRAKCARLISFDEKVGSGDETIVYVQIYNAVVGGGSVQLLEYKINVQYCRSHQIIFILGQSW